jgi:rod shape-determining protein MreC
VTRHRAAWRRVLAAILVVLSVGLLTFYFREPANGPVHRAQDAGLRLLAPLQSGTARAIKPFRDGWNWTAELFRARSENARLQKEVDALRNSVTQLQALQEQNAELTGLVGLKNQGIYPKGCRLVAARVIASSPTAWYSTVTISAGSAQGVKLYDAVVNDQGLVGRVTAVTSDAAEVTLITDQSSYVDAMVLVPHGRSPLGILAGSVTGDLSLQYVDKAAQVSPGELVATSGMKGSIFVRGIPIGVVTSVAQQDVELYQSISVKPFVDFHTLDLVMVVER